MTVFFKSTNKVPSRLCYRYWKKRLVRPLSEASVASRAPWAVGSDAGDVSVGLDDILGEVPGLQDVWDGVRGVGGVLGLFRR